MGDISEMMLDGILCEGCGEYLGEGGGFPTRCAGCAPEVSEADPVWDWWNTVPKPRKNHAPRKLCCIQCRRTLLNQDALNQHWRDTHRSRAP